MTKRGEPGRRIRQVGGIGRSAGRAVAHNFGLKVASILVAFGLWLFVNGGERDTEAAFQVALELRNIPANLMMVSPRIEFVDLRVSGPRTLLSRIDPRKLAVPLDLQGVRPGPAVFRILAEALNLPRGVNVLRLTPSEITLEFARVRRKTVPVRLSVTGTPPGGARITATKIAPEVVEVIGPEDEVEETQAVETAPIDLSDSDPGLIERDVALEVPREYLSFSATLVRVQIELEEPERERRLEKVPVVVRNSPYRTQVAPETMQISVRGPQSSVESLELSPGAVYIDASGYGPGRYEREVSVDLPVDVQLVETRPKTVRLEVLEEKRKGDAE